MPELHIGGLMCARADGDTPLNRAEAEWVHVESTTAACLLVLDDGTKLAFDREALLSELGAGTDEARAA